MYEDRVSCEGVGNEGVFVEEDCDTFDMVEDAGLVSLGVKMTAGVFTGRGD